MSTHGAVTKPSAPCRNLDNGDIRHDRLAINPAELPVADRPTTNPVQEVGNDRRQVIMVDELPPAIPHQPGVTGQDVAQVGTGQHPASSVAYGYPVAKLGSFMEGDRPGRRGGHGVDNYHAGMGGKRLKMTFSKGVGHLMG